TPVVAAAVGGLTTAVADGRSGLLVPGHNPADFAAALHRIIADRPLAAALAAGGVQHTAGFSWDRTASELVAAYTEAMVTPSYAVPLAR
nr:glycosyltransferase [Geodermatophilaceae bacterium]